MNLYLMRRFNFPLSLYQFYSNRVNLVQMFVIKYNNNDDLNGIQNVSSNKLIHTILTLVFVWQGKV